MASCAAETGMVAMDCLVVCCCCPCLVLQVTVFLFVRLPKRVVVKTKRIILRRWHRRRPSAAAASKGGAGCAASAAGLKLEELLDLEDGFEAAFGIRDGGFFEGWKKRCFPVVDNDDDDGVWEAIIEQEGLFWFGSFWGRTEQEGSTAGGDDQMGGRSFRVPVGLERVCE